MSTKTQPGRGRQKQCVTLIHATKGKRNWPKSKVGYRSTWGMNAVLSVLR